MTQQVALICTTERIDGYTDNVAKTELYAANISTALMTSGTTPLVTAAISFCRIAANGTMDNSIVLPLTFS